ncbi:MAG: hypothetical protein ACHP7J_04855 [Terriglobales bacterium]
MGSAGAPPATKLNVRDESLALPNLHTIRRDVACNVSGGGEEDVASYVSTA